MRALELEGLLAIAEDGAGERERGDLPSALLSTLTRTASAHTHALAAATAGHSPTGARGQGQGQGQGEGERLVGSGPLSLCAAEC